MQNRVRPQPEVRQLPGISWNAGTNWCTARGTPRCLPRPTGRGLVRPFQAPGPPDAGARTEAGALNCVCLMARSMA